MTNSVNGKAEEQRLNQAENNVKNKSYEKPKSRSEKEEDEYRHLNYLFALLLILLFIGVIFIIYKIEDFLKPLREFRPDYDFPSVSDFKYTIFFTPIVMLIRFIVEKCTYSFFYAFSKKEYLNPADEKNYKLGIVIAKKNAINFFKLVYYIVITIIAHGILKNLDYFPKILFGNGDIENLFKKGFPDQFFHEKPDYFNIYYVGTVAFHVVDSIHLLFITEIQSDYLMMLLHHACTISLIVFSYLSNYSNMGCLVLFLHDATDIFVYITRIILNTNSNNFLRLLSGLVLFFTYSYSRIYVFSQILIVCRVAMAINHNWIFETMYIFCFILIILHIIWTFMIIKKIFQAIFKKKYEDSFKIKKFN